MDTEHNAITEPVRRFEVFTGAGRRRTWSIEAKARIVAESLTSEDSVCAVARRHGLSPQQLFGWRRQARQSASRSAEKEAPLFVPAVVDAPALTATPRGRGPRRARRADAVFGMIDLEIDGVTVRVGRGADVKTVVAVIRALKACP
jgi:transposase